MSFSRQFTPRVSVSRTKKFPLEQFKGEGHFFWEELQQKPIKKVDTRNHQSVGHQILHSQNSVLTQHVDVPYLEPGKNLIESPPDRYLEPGKNLIEFPPDFVALQSDLIRAKHPSDLLLLSTESMDPIHLATCLYRMVRLCDSQPSSVKKMVREDSRFEALLICIGQTLDDQAVGPVWLSNVLYAVSKGKLTPVWLPSLISRTIDSVPCMELEQIGSCMYSAASLPGVSDLIDTLVVAANTIPITNNHQLVSICTSLARLGRFEKSLFLQMSDITISKINEMSMNDICSVLWSFTKSKQMDSLLIKSVCDVLERKISDCSPRNLVNIVWSLAKSKNSNSELFKFTIAPAIRKNMPEMSVRELCTILWSYSTLSISDPDFYNDLAICLLPQIDQMNAHDLSSVAWGLSNVNFRNGHLHSALGKAAKRLKSDFTPLQLTRVIFGLNNPSVLKDLAEEAKKSMHLLYTQNLVEILLGLDRSGLAKELGSDFLKAIDYHKLSGRDSVQVLSILANSFPMHHDSIEKLVSIIAERFNCSGRWIPTGFDLVDLVDAMAKIPEMTENNQLTEKVLLHFSTCYRSPSFTVDLFLRLVAGLGNWDCKANIHSLLQKRQNGIASGFSDMTTQLLSASHLLTADQGAEIFHMFAKLNFCNDDILKLGEICFDRFDRISDPNDRVILLIDFTQLGLFPEWTIDQLDSMEIEELGPDALIGLVWARFALGDTRVVSSAVLDRIGRGFASELPVNMYRANQVILSVGDSGGLDWKAFVKEMKSIRGGNHRVVRKYSALISHAISQLGIVHKHQHKVLGCYQVTASLPKTEPVVILDLAEPDSVVSPSGSKFTGEKILKNIHLCREYRLLNLRMKEIHTALEASSLNVFIADLVAPYNDKAKERVSFKKKISLNSIVEDILK